MDLGNIAKTDLATLFRIAYDEVLHFLKGGELPCNTHHELVKRIF